MIPGKWRLGRTGASTWGKRREARSEAEAAINDARRSAPFPHHQRHCLMAFNETEARHLNEEEKHHDDGLKVAMDASSSRNSTPLQSPRLPPEILLNIFQSPCLSPVLSPTTLTTKTLHTLLLCSRLSHACAKQQLNEVLVLPRHVREFRRFYDTERQRGWPALGITRGIFCALDDLSRLTHTSTGWEVAFLRTLHLLGPQVTHLSLWHSESRVLLRDAGQVQRQSNTSRVTESCPVWLWGQDDEELRRNNADSSLSAGGGEDENASDIKEETASFQVNAAAAAVAAMRERARLQMPNWLKRELESKPFDEVARTHWAHLISYGESVRGKADALEQHLVEALRAHGRIKGCRPRYLSLILSLPLFENQDPSLFASLIVFSRCQELDAYLPVPSHAPKLLFLLSHLQASPLRRIKITTTHATLGVALPPFNTEQAIAMKGSQRRRKAGEGRFRLYSVDNPWLSDGSVTSFHEAQSCEALRDGPGESPHINVASALAAMLRDGDLRECLHREFAGKHVNPEAAHNLERLLTHRAIESAEESGIQRGAIPTLPRRSQAFDRQGQKDIERIRVRIIQGKQLAHGRLKDRRDDFVTRVMGLGQGVWEQCGLWDTMQSL